MMSRTLWIVAGVCAALMLGGCEQTKNILGLNKRAPDEFAVYSRAPLSLPPDYGLRPPEPGTDRPELVMPRDEAIAALAGKAPTAVVKDEKVKTPSDPGTDALLRELGASNPDPNIRQEVNRETTVLADESTTFADKLIFWRAPQPTDSVLDPVAEAKRLREAKALGKPINEGDVPVISRKKRGLLEGIF